MSKYKFGFILGEYVTLFSVFLIVINLIIRGAYSEVFLATSVETGDKVAIKRIHKLSKDDLWYVTSDRRGR